MYFMQLETCLTQIGPSCTTGISEPLTPERVQEIIDAIKREREGNKREPRRLVPIPRIPGDEDNRYIYRAINWDEVDQINETGGFERRKPWLPISMADHIRISQGGNDPWVSASRSEQTARRISADGNDRQVIKVDRARLTYELYDLSSGGTEVLDALNGSTEGERKVRGAQ